MNDNAPEVTLEERIERLEQAVAGVTAILLQNYRLMASGYPWLGPWAAEGARLATERQYAIHEAVQAARSADSEARRAAAAEAPLRVASPR